MANFKPIGYEENINNGILKYGEVDPATGSQMQTFTPNKTPVVNQVSSPTITAQTPSSLYQDYTTPEEKAVQDQLNAQAKSDLNAPLDEATIRKNVTDQFQSEIDAANRIYAEQKAKLLGQAQVQGQGRLGSLGAVQARRGLLGSDFGTSQENLQTQANTQEQNAIEQQQNALLNSELSRIQGNIRTTVSENLGKKREAAKQGADSLLAYYRNQREDKAKQADSYVTSLINKGVEPDKATLDLISKSFGVPVETILNDYNAKKKALIPEPTKPVTISAGQRIVDPLTGKVIYEAPIEAEPNKPISLSAGQVLVDAQGKVIYQAPFKPEDAATGKIIKVNGVDYQQNPDGSLSLPKTPETATPQEKIAKADDIVKSIDLLVSMPGLAGAVGPISSRLPTISGKTADFEAGLNNLIAKIAIENLSLLKGPMSDKDIQFIKEASSGLNVGMSEQGLKNRLEQIKQKFLEIKGKANVPAEKTEQDPLGLGLSLNTGNPLNLGFNQVGSDTNNANQITPIKVGNKTVTVNKTLGDKLLQAAELMFGATGKYPLINQAFRTFAQQKSLYEKLSKTGAQVAPAGKSFHEKGLAIDVTNWKEAEPYLRKVGLLNNLKNDKGHFSYKEFL